MIDDLLDGMAAGSSLDDPKKKRRGIDLLRALAEGTDEPPAPRRDNHVGDVDLREGFTPQSGLTTLRELAGDAEAPAPITMAPVVVKPSARRVAAESVADRAQAAGGRAPQRVLIDSTGGIVATGRPVNDMQRTIDNLVEAGDTASLDRLANADDLKTRTAVRLAMARSHDGVRVAGRESAPDRAARAVGDFIAAAPAAPLKVGMYLGQHGNDALAAAEAADRRRMAARGENLPDAEARGLAAPADENAPTANETLAALGLAVSPREAVDAGIQTVAMAAGPLIGRLAGAAGARVASKALGGVGAGRYAEGARELSALERAIVERSPGLVAGAGHATGAAAEGAALGAAFDPEHRGRGAAIGAGLGLAGNAAARAGEPMARLPDTRAPETDPNRLLPSRTRAYASTTERPPVAEPDYSVSAPNTVEQAVAESRINQLRPRPRVVPEPVQPGVTPPEHVAVRVGPITADGAYFERTAGAPSEGAVPYDLRDVNLADGTDAATVQRITSALIEDPSLTPAQREHVAGVQQLGVIDAATNDTLPIARVAQQLGYDGLQVAPVDPKEPPSVFVWNIRTMKPASVPLTEAPGVEPAAPPSTTPAQRTENAAPEAESPYAASREGVTTLYHGTSPATALRMALGGEDKSGLFVSPREELALGQGGKTGGLVEFGNTDHIDVERHVKPGSDLSAHQTGEWPEYRVAKMPHDGNDVVRSVTLDAGARVPSYLLRRAQALGWTQHPLSEGRVQFRNPTIAGPAGGGTEPTGARVPPPHGGVAGGIRPDVNKLLAAESESLVTAGGSAAPSRDEDQPGWWAEQEREARAAEPPVKKAYDYSSTQLDLPPEHAAAIRQLGTTIPDAHLAEDGREDAPHITVKYGLHGNEPEKLRALLADQPPITVTLGKTSIFPDSGSGDVVKVDVDSPALHAVNKKIADALPHTDTHPGYKPHATVAYVKKGLGKQYAGNASLEGRTITFDRLTFSGKDGTKVEIPLGGARHPLAAPSDAPLPRDLDTPEIRALDARAAAIPRTDAIDTPARNEWRQQQIERLAQFSTPGHVAHIVLGLPGSGKSSMLAVPLVQSSGAALLDNDLVKAAAPEYAGGLGATALHPESAKVRLEALRRVMAQGGNVVFPTVGDPTGTVDLARTLLDAGYTVHVHMADVPPDVSARRVLEGYKSGARHFISPRAILEYGANPRRAVAALAELPGVIVHDPLDNDVPRGTAPHPVPDWRERWGFPDAEPPGTSPAVRPGGGPDGGRVHGGGDSPWPGGRDHPEAPQAGDVDKSQGTVDEDGVTRFRSARTPSGVLRPVARVSTRGLLQELLDLEPKRAAAESRSIYELRDDPNFHTSGIPQVVSTKAKGGGPSMQAKAAQNLKGYAGVTERVYRELAARMPVDDIWHAVDDVRAEQDERAGADGRYAPPSERDVLRDERGAALFSPAEERASRPRRASGTPRDVGDLFSPAAPGQPLAAATAAARGTPPPSAQQVREVKSLAEIARTLAQLVDVPLRQGRFLAGARRAVGAFFQQREVARVVRFDRLETVAHEIGHFLSQKYLRNPTMGGAAARGAQSLPMAAKRELVQMGKALYGTRKPAGGYGEEGIAQWARFYVTDPARLAKEAPSFGEWADANLLAKEPALKAALDQTRADFAEYQAAPATARVDAMLDVAPSRRFLPTARRLMTTMIDDLAEIRRAVGMLGTGTNPSRNAYILARLTRGGAGMAEEMIEHGIVDPTTQRRVTRGIAQVLGQLTKEDVQPFRRYLVAERTLELAARGIDPGITVADATDVVARYGATYRPIAEELWTISNALIDYRQKKGLLTADEARTIKEKNTKRVGFYRVFDDDERASGGRGAGKGFGRNSSGVQSIKGSARPIIDPLESLLTDVYRTVQQSHAADVLSALVEHADHVQGGGRVIEVLTERPKRAVRINVADVQEQLADLGFEIPNGGLEDVEGVLTAFEPLSQASAKETKDLVRPLVIRGERKWIQIADAPLYDALNGLGTPQMSAVWRWVSIPTRVLRAGATLTAEFIARNPVRDAWSAAIYSRAGTRPPGWDFGRGLFHVLKADHLYEDWRLDGGDNAAMLGLDRVDAHKHVAQLLRSPARKAADWVLRPIDTLRVLSSLFENATRVGEYAGLRKKFAKEGMAEPDARAAAALGSRDVTIDFARAGEYGRQVNQIVAFFNANAQGWDKLAREFRHNPESVIPRILAFITIPSVLLYLLQKDDPAYQEVPAWQKGLAWVIVQRGAPRRLSTGRTPTREEQYAAEHGDVEHIWRIPKPPDLGVLFGTVPERILEWVNTKNPHVLDRALNDLSTLNPLHMPNAIGPLTEWWANKSWFTDRPIVPEGLANLPPGEQATSRTGELARLVGRTTHLSPAKLENAAKGAAGGLATYGMDLGNLVVRGGRSVLGLPALPHPEQRRGDALATAPLVKGFAVRMPQLDAQSVEEALDQFNTADAYRQAWRRKLEAGDRAGAHDYFKAHEADIRSVAGTKDGLGRTGYLHDAHALIVDAQRVSRDASEDERARVADVAVRAARAALSGDRASRLERLRLRTEANALDRKGQRLMLRSRFGTP